MADSFSRYDIYTTTGSIYCYTGTNVLKNRFGIRNVEQLKKIETDISVIRQNDLLSKPISGRFTSSHLCRIHRYLFGDLYSFAGHFRREDIMKGNTRFLGHQSIKRQLTRILNELHAENCLQGISFDQLVERSAYYFAELNYIHPFREGNGRSTREFMRLLFLSCGYSVDWTAVPVQELLDAMELSVYDTTALQRILRDCLQKNDI